MMSRIDTDALRTRVAVALFQAGNERLSTPDRQWEACADAYAVDAAYVLAALGLDDLDAAVTRANVDHPHTGLQIGTDCSRAVLEAALAPVE